MSNTYRKVLVISGLIFFLFLFVFVFPAQVYAGGEILAWGCDYDGICDVPEPNTNFKAISAGFEDMGSGSHSLGLKQDGSIIAWGANSFGQCDVPIPNTDYTAVTAGCIYSMALKSDGSIVAWGNNALGQCNVPQPNTGFSAVSAGFSHSLGLKADGSVVAWGWNGDGQCNVPEPNTNFKAIATGYGHSLGLKTDGSIIAWGDNTYGQCDVPEPNTGFTAIAAGLYYSLGLRADGSIAAWGNDDLGQCTVPLPNTGFMAIAAGTSYSLGLKTEGSIAAWGNNDFGQCTVPQPNNNFTAIAAGTWHSLGIVGKYSGGDGSAENPYQIGNPDDLLLLAADTNDYNDCFILINDINLAGYSFTRAVIAPLTDDLDIGVFNGIFDGNCHIIRNMTIEANNNDNLSIGLFGQIGSEGIVKNLGVVDVYVTGGIQSWDVGGLCGENRGGSIKNCYSTGTVMGNDRLGGLCGGGWGYIRNCYSNCTVTGDDSIGGLCGDNDCEINNCYSTGTVTGDRYVGGLCGGNYEMIRCAYSTGIVIGSQFYVGGLVGGGINNYTAASFWDTETSGLSVSTGGEGLDTETMQDMDIYSINGWSGEDWTIDNGNDYPHLIWENAVGQPIAEPNITLNGLGTAECPYEIANAQDLQLLSGIVFLWDKHFVLTNDIDLTGYDIEPIGHDITPVYYDYGSICAYYGFEGQFQGVLDGNGHVISNLIIEANDWNYVGLFKCIGPNAVIKNLGIKDANIIVYSHIGSLVGINTGTISNCFGTGTFSANNTVGGLVGMNYKYYGSGIANVPKVTGCHANVTINGLEDIGGLIGYNDRGIITDCYSIGEIKGHMYAGGLIGYSHGGSIENCYNRGVVDCNFAAGGLVGYNDDGTITNCYNSGIVNSSSSVGGLVGYHFGVITTCYNTGAVSGYSAGGVTGNNGGDIINCYNTGNVAGDSYVGGLVGENAALDSSGSLLWMSQGSVTNCYSTGAVSCSEWEWEWEIGVGGLVGYDSEGNSVFDSFWDVNTSGKTTSAGGIGKTTAQMQTLSTFTDAGWDFSYADGNEAVWFMPNEAYPILVWQISSADIYTDGKNNFKDFAVFADYWMRDDCAMYNYYCDFADLDFDGDVDIDDLFEFMNYWLQEGIYN